MTEDRRLLCRRQGNRIGFGQVGVDRPDELRAVRRGAREFGGSVVLVERFFRFDTAIFNGVSQGLQPLASEAHAKGEAEEKKKILTKSVLTGIVLTVVLIGSVWIFAPQITDVFNSEHSEQLAAYAVPGIRIYFAGFFAAAINIIFAGFLSATDHAKESSIVAITRGIVAIIAFALVLPKFLGITGVWLAFPAAEVLTLFVALVISKKN